MQKGTEKIKGTEVVERKDATKMIMDPGCAEGFQSLICVNSPGHGALSVKTFVLG